jgi:hypothetical protein
MQTLLLCRVLMVADISACTIALLQATMSAYRVANAAPGKSIFKIYLGLEHWLFNLGFLLLIYQTCALLPLLAMALNTFSQPSTAAAAAGEPAAAGRSSSNDDESFYTRHRHALCLLNRLLRLFYSTAQLLLPGATSYYAHAIAARTQGLRPMKALLVNVLHPTVFWMAQVCCWLVGCSFFAQGFGGSAGGSFLQAHLGNIGHEHKKMTC